MFLEYELQLNDTFCKCGYPATNIRPTHVVEICCENLLRHLLGYCGILAEVDGINHQSLF
jgi:hypothetical protein